MPTTNDDEFNLESLGIQADTEAKESTPTFDFSSLRLSQNFSAGVSVTKLLNTVPVRNPDKNDYFRVHPSDDHTLTCGVIEFKADNQIFIVSCELHADLALDMTTKTLYHAITRQGVNFLWPVKLPDEEGNLDSWNKSKLEAADIAKNNWIRLVANRHLGAYEVLTANGNLPEPSWPKQTFQELLAIAFKGRIIDSLGHPAVRRLRGED